VLRDGDWRSEGVLSDIEGAVGSVDVELGVGFREDVERRVGLRWFVRVREEKDLISEEGELMRAWV
jgi:hypothetical protein